MKSGLGWLQWWGVWIVVETAALMEPIMYDIFHCTGYTQLAIPRIEYKTQILFVPA